MSYESLWPSTGVTQHQKSESTPDVVPEKPHMADVLSSLFASGKYSDLVIKCRGKRWNVHRMVVCTQSRPIGAALDGGYIESTTGEFTLEEDDPEAVQLLLKFMYTGKLDIELPPASPTKPLPLTQTATEMSISEPSQSDRRPRIQAWTPANGPTGVSYGIPQAYNFAAQNNWVISNNNPYAQNGVLSSGNTSSWQPVTIQSVQAAQLNAIRAQNASLNQTHLLPLPQNAYNTGFPLGSAPNPGPSAGFPLVSGFSPSPSMSNQQTSSQPLGTSSNPIHLSPKTKSSNLTTPMNLDSKPLSKGLLSSTDVYILADKYDVQPLKLLACDAYKELCETHWDSEEFIQSLSMIFDGTPDTNEKDILRKVALETAVAHAKELLVMETFQELCQDRGDITTAVLIGSVDKPSPKSTCAWANSQEQDVYDYMQVAGYPVWP